MKKSIDINSAQWEAVKNNDPSADGSFYYGVKTTGIFCLPSCKSKLSLKKNIIFFDTYQLAIAAGFRPCKRCRPDVYATYQPNEELLCRIKKHLDSHSTNPQCLQNLNELFHVSPSHLVRIFKERFGSTPSEYLRARRVELAQELLTSTDLRIIDIAFKSGFSSYTTFFTTFKKLVGMPPDQYRKGGSL